MNTSSSFTDHQDLLGLLRKVKIFSEVDDDDLIEIAEQLTEMNYRSGQSVFKKGDEGDAMYS
jgi:hypothetical protein